MSNKTTNRNKKPQFTFDELIFIQNLSIGNLDKLIHDRLDKYLPELVEFGKSIIKKIETYRNPFNEPITRTFLKANGEYLGVIGDYNLDYYRYNDLLYFVDSGGEVLTRAAYNRLIESNLLFDDNLPF